MKELLTYRQRMLTHWENTVPTLQRFVARFPDEVWYRKPPNGSWSAHQILSHLCDLEEQVFFPCIRAFLSEYSAPMPLYPSNEAWLLEYEPTKSVADLLATYKNLRVQEANWVKELPVEGWIVLRRHPQVGLRTVEWWVEQSLAVTRQHMSWLEQSTKSDFSGMISSGKAAV